MSDRINKCFYEDIVLFACSRAPLTCARSDECTVIGVPPCRVGPGGRAQKEERIRNEAEINAKIVPLVGYISRDLGERLL